MAFVLLNLCENIGFLSIFLRKINFSSISVDFFAEKAEKSEKVHGQFNFFLYNG